MKTIILVPIILISQFSFAQRKSGKINYNKKYASMTRPFAEKITLSEIIQKAHMSGKNPMDNPEVNHKISLLLNSNMLENKKLNSIEVNSLKQLISASPTIALPEIKRLVSIMRSETTSDAKYEAFRTLKSLAENAKKISFLELSNKENLLDLEASNVIKMTMKNSGVAHTNPIKRILPAKAAVKKYSALDDLQKHIESYNTKFFKNFISKHQDMTEPIAELRYYIHNTKNIELQIVAMNGIINFARKITKDYTGQYVINVETQLKMIDMNGPISHEVNEMIIQELFYINHKSRK